MKIFSIGTSLLIVLFITVSIAGEKYLSVFDWLQGEWICIGNKADTKEVWQKVSPQTFEGFAATIDKTIGEHKITETLRLVNMSGDIYYIANVEHNELPIAFKLNDSAESIFVFENASHDFPKRIEYRQMPGDSLYVTVGDSTRSFVVKFKKVSKAQ